MSKGLEALDNLMFDLDYHRRRESQYYYPKEEREEYCGTIEKELKALEIVKKKSIWPIFILVDVGLEYYNDNYDVKLTQDEYDLLKGVLCED